jgi:hypothetical protein
MERRWAFTLATIAESCPPIGQCRADRRIKMISAPPEPVPLESIDEWRLTPLDISKVAMWRLPMEPNYPIRCFLEFGTKPSVYDYIRDHLGYRHGRCTALGW